MTCFGHLWIELLFHWSILVSELNLTRVGLLWLKDKFILSTFYENSFKKGFYGNIMFIEMNLKNRFEFHHFPFSWNYRISILIPLNSWECHVLCAWEVHDSCSMSSCDWCVFPIDHRNWKVLKCWDHSNAHHSIRPFHSLIC